MNLDSVDRIRLTHLPTPLHDLPRLAKELGLRRLLVKRDDLTSLAMGGNKARKLEYDLAPCVREQCDVVLTIGGVQSNHARMTAAAARMLGIEPKLVLGGPEFSGFPGNLLLDLLMGAEIRYLTNDDDNDHLAAAMAGWAGELRAAGHKPFTLPIGGSTGRGALGYVEAMRELAGQFGQEPASIVVGVGSCGTLAGTVLGARLFMPRARVVGISVSRSSLAIATRTTELIREASVLLALEPGHDEPPIESYDRYHEEYGTFTDSGREAIMKAARLEGLLLDPVYTGKAMAGLVDLVQRDVLDRSAPVIFIHTGGLPISFAFEKDLCKDARFVRL
jgi:D-cysteine desulfhydrase family pyridoxal phosphate-dependent enzyme